MSKLSRQTRQINKGSKKIAAAGGDISKANLSNKQLNARLDNSLIAKKYDNYHTASDPIIKEQYKAGLNLKNAKQAVRGGMRPDTVASFGLGGDLKGDYGKLLNSKAYQNQKAEDAGYKNARQQRRAKEADNKPTNSKKVTTTNNTVPRESSKQSAEGDAWLKKQNESWASSSNNPANKSAKPAAAGAKPTAKPNATAVKPSVNKDPNAGKIRLTQDSDGDWVDKDGNLPTMQMRGKTFKDSSGNQITNTINPTTGQNRSIIIPSGVKSGQPGQDIGTNITRGTALAASGTGSKDPLDNSANNNMAKTVDKTNVKANGGAGKGSHIVSSVLPYGDKKESTNNNNVASNTNDPSGSNDPGVNNTNTSVKKENSLETPVTKKDLRKQKKDGDITKDEFKSKKKALKNNKPEGDGDGDGSGKVDLASILKPSKNTTTKTSKPSISDTSSSGNASIAMGTVKMTGLIT